ncbi:hypothetical protein ALC60_07214 [Trachymyrmex zeteki]|uniref:Uncharacterized protein n=1 Tax=Mycetomoellerius zeteki TaxID=64791 RepID=A0A151X0V2_9HYME|nr:hypothetical protein ALC60_07214 [Trachymyrmex zeteki]
MWRVATWCASSRHRVRASIIGPSGTSTCPRKGSHAVSGPLSIQLNPWGRTYGIRQRGDANVTSLRQITILLWDKRRSQLKRRVVNRILQNAKIDTLQT